MQTRTVRVRLTTADRITDCVITRCPCGRRQYISDKDAAVPGVFECECGEPFAMADIYGNVYPIGARIRKGVGDRV